MDPRQGNRRSSMVSPGRSQRRSSSQEMRIGVSQEPQPPPMDAAQRRRLQQIQRQQMLQSRQPRSVMIQHGTSARPAQSNQRNAPQRPTSARNVNGNANSNQRSQARAGSAPRSERSLRSQHQLPAVGANNPAKARPMQRQVQQNPPMNEVDREIAMRMEHHRQMILANSAPSKNQTTAATSARSNSQRRQVQQGKSSRKQPAPTQDSVRSRSRNRSTSRNRGSFIRSVSATRSRSMSREGRTSKKQLSDAAREALGTAPPDATEEAAKIDADEKREHMKLAQQRQRELQDLHKRMEQQKQLHIQQRREAIAKGKAAAAAEAATATVPRKAASNTNNSKGSARSIFPSMQRPKNNEGKPNNQNQQVQQAKPRPAPLTPARREQLKKQLQEHAVQRTEEVRQGKNPTKIRQKISEAATPSAQHRAPPAKRAPKGAGAATSNRSQPAKKAKTKNSTRSDHHDIEHASQTPSKHQQGPITDEEPTASNRNKSAAPKRGDRSKLYWTFLLLGLVLALTGAAMSYVRYRMRNNSGSAAATQNEGSGGQNPSTDGSPTSSPNLAPSVDGGKDDEDEDEDDKKTPNNEWQERMEGMIRRATTDETVFDAKDSPQAKALHWMLQVDPLDYNIVNARVLQRYALAAFYFSTGGEDSWQDNDWMESDECDGSAWFGTSCNEDRQVRAIAFDNHGLVGSIPEEIGLLSMLENLIIKNNLQLVGPIPLSLGKLAALRQLGLYSNRLTGSLPPELSEAYNLKYLNLEDNRLGGTIPTEYERFFSLRMLSLSNNFLRGDIPFHELARTDVEHLSLSNNKLTGTMDGSIQHFVYLKDLMLDKNELKGAIPSEIGLLTTLTNLDLSHNNFDGLLPPQIGKLRFLKSLALSNNELSGDLPQNVGLLVYLQYLNMSANKFSGRVPNISNLAQLKYLHLSDNDLTGPFPEAIQQLLNVEVIYLSGNKLSGSIPATIDRLSNSVRGLYLSDNNFGGPIPFAFCDFFDLEALFLDSNRLDGRIPACLGELTRLRQLYVFRNRLMGEIPSTLSKLSRLTGLGLEANNFDGKVPDEICVRDVELWADCNTQPDGGAAVTCACCDVCCPGSDCI